jgi:hypothetical protein
MFTSRSDSERTSLLNCGLVRERGTVRTSTSLVTPWFVSSDRKPQVLLVECPAVITSGFSPRKSVSRSGIMSAFDPQFRARLHGQHMLERDFNTRAVLAGGCREEFFPEHRFYSGDFAFG